MNLKELKEAMDLKCSLQAMHVVLVKMEITLKKTLRASEQDRPDIARARQKWKSR